LSIAERILVVEQIWDSIAAEESSLPVTPSQQSELDRRLAAWQEGRGEDGSSWEAVRMRIEKHE
jgi:putative addiction module component (TIGR02574 family)